jgi:hypothetical protein
MAGTLSSGCSLTIASAVVVEDVRSVSVLFARQAEPYLPYCLGVTSRFTSKVNIENAASVGRAAKQDFIDWPTDDED